MKSVSRSEKFVRDKVERWRKLKGIINDISAGRRLYDMQIKGFPGLYRLVCSDLAEARMLKLSPDVIEYLNSIVGQAHRILYSKPPLKTSQIVSFFKTTVPFTFLQNWIFIACAASFFLLPYFVTYHHTVSNPEFAGKIINEEMLAKMAESYSEGFTDSRESGTNSFMASYYIQHNTSIGFYSFASGILLGLGTLYFLVYNGITLGCITGYIVSLGLGKNLWTFVCGHSVFELTALILAGAAGLMLGYLVINAGRYRRTENIDMNKERILTLTGVYVVLFLLAALIEGFISPSPYPLWFKISVGIFSLLCIIGYFMIYPIYIRTTQKTMTSFNR